MLAQHGLGIRPECARVLRVLTMLLQKAAARGLTPFAIGSIMCRLRPCSSMQLACWRHRALQKSPSGAAKVLPSCKHISICASIRPTST